MSDFTPAMLRLNSVLLSIGLLLTSVALGRSQGGFNDSFQGSAPATLDLREPMALAAAAIPPRLDAKMNYRPWFLLRGQGGIPVEPVHASWDLADMTGRYLESLLLARRMGVSGAGLAEAEGRLRHFLFEILGSDGLVHDPKTGAIDHSFSQGSALYGLLALFEDSHDPKVREALQRLITAQLRRAERHGDQLVDPTVKLAESSGSHLAGYQIYPVIRFYELTGYNDALTLAEGLTQWAMADPTIGPNGEITKALSWEGHIHSWLDTLAGCARTARNSTRLDRPGILARCRAVYDWVRRTNATSFGWIATYPTGGSCETCAISSAIRLALELAATGHPEYLEDVERFVRNQVVEAQFRTFQAYDDVTNHPTRLLVGCFDSQSMPNGHLGTRGGEDVGNVEGCCLNGGMRALALAWDAIESSDEKGTTVNLSLNRSGPACDVLGYEPLEGRVDVIARFPGSLRIRVPSWVDSNKITVSLNAKPTHWDLEQRYVVLKRVNPGARVSVEYPLREQQEIVSAGGQQFQVRWKGDVVVGVEPPGQREPTYQRTAAATAEQKRAGSRAAEPVTAWPLVPDTYVLRDAAHLAALSMLARLDLQRDGQPFFRIYPFSTPPRAEHEKWDDGDMSGRYVEGLILSRRITGMAIDAREILLRHYLSSLFDSGDGLCYTRGTAWTPRRACLFSQSSAMLGLLAWYRETSSPEARKVIDKQVDGLMHIAVTKGEDAYFPKYEFDGKEYVNDPPDKDAPIWYGGRLVLPLADYWHLSGRQDVKAFLEKLVHYCTQTSHFIKPDGEVEKGPGWWGHLHSTMDMAAGIAEFGLLANRPELIAWSKRIYDWIGRTQTTRYGFVADVAGGNICESCAIASRIRLGLVLYRAGVAEPFGEIDRYLRNQLIENQFVDVSFMNPLKRETPRTDQAIYNGVDCMVRGTFQCWGTANDRIGHDDIEGCGAGGGVQAVALAWDAQAEWRNTAQGQELRVNLLFNRKLPANPQAGFVSAVPVAAELWSYLPFQGRVVISAQQAIERLALRLPDGVDLSSVSLKRCSASPQAELSSDKKPEQQAIACDGSYATISGVKPGEILELAFKLRQYETTEHAAGRDYRVEWKGSSVTGISPAGTKEPLYANRSSLQGSVAPACAARYP